MPRVPPRAWLAAFAELGLTSLGGWLAYYHDALVVRRGWLTDREFLEGSSISNLVPGPIFVNFAVYAGRRLGGWIAVAPALALIVLPGTLAMLGLSVAYEAGLGQSPLVRAGLRGIAAAGAAFTAVTALRLLGARRRDPRALFVAGLTVLALGVLGLGLVPAVPLLALVALWLHRPRSPAEPPA